MALKSVRLSNKLILFKSVFELPIVVSCARLAGPMQNLAILNEHVNEFID